MYFVKLNNETTMDMFVFAIKEEFMFVKSKIVEAFRNAVDLNINENMSPIEETNEINVHNLNELERLMYVMVFDNFFGIKKKVISVVN